MGHQIQIRNVVIVSLGMFLLVGCANLDSYIKQGKYDSAETYCSQQSNVGRQRDCYGKLASAHFARGDFKSAAADYSRAGDRANARLSYEKLADGYVAGSDFARATEYFGEYYGNNKLKQKMAYGRLSAIELASGDLQISEKHFKLSDAYDNAEAKKSFYERLAPQLVQKGLLADAVAAYDLLGDKDNLRKSHLALAVELKGAGKPLDAAEHFEKGGDEANARGMYFDAGIQLWNKGRQALGQPAALSKGFQRVDKSQKEFIERSRERDKRIKELEKSGNEAALSAEYQMGEADAKATMRANNDAFADFAQRIMGLKMLEAGIDVLRKCGRFDLFFAAMDKDGARAEGLIKSGANTNAPFVDGRTPLMMASAVGSVPIATLLVKNKADLDARDEDGTTPLMYAASNGHADLVKLLLAKRANKASKNSQGKTALDLAKQSKASAELVPLLE